MGNYENIEVDFIKRTLALISQYESMLHKYKFKEQFNFTLLINCLLGLVVMPNKKSFNYLPKATLLNKKFREEIGLINSIINPEIKNLKELIGELRNSIAHFDISVESLDEQNLIDNIIFKNNGVEIANFSANELLPFIRYYSDWLISNIEKYKK